MTELDKEVALVFKGFEALTSAQKAKIQGMIIDFMRGNDHTRKELNESVIASLESYSRITKMQTGPSGVRCLYCGK